MAFTGTLTDDQIEHAQRVRDHWMRVGLSTDRCDRPRAEAAVRAAYRAADIPEPQLVVWMDSPLGGVFAAAMIRELPKLGGQLGDQLGDQLRDQLRGQLRGQLGDQLGDQLWGQLWGQLGGQLRGQLGGQLRGQLRDQLRGQLGGQLWGQLGLEISAWWDAYWLAYYTCALPFADLEASPRLDALATVCEEAGWWWPMHGAVVLTDRPTTINRDKEGRLHSGDGPTLAYADGYELYSWHGTRVPADLIGGWTIPQIVAERNTEVRRCAVERMGWDVFLAEADATLVAEADDPGNSPHTLRLYDLPDYLDDAFSEPARIVLCTNGSAERDGTRHRYGITVRKRFNDPVAAMADTYGVATEVYRQLETRR